ncbi:MAG: B12-binding domain-containing radical SAM protein [Pirellulales bacterium]|nr:B12-binding domain-containing radical SAM protein [Pirellulales bacterium]
MIATGPEKLRILLIKPYQTTTALIHMPPLGLLYLASTLRQRFGDTLEIRFIDQRLDQRRYWDIDGVMDEFRPHVIGISALNLEAEESGRIAHRVKQRWPNTLTVLGGPLAHGGTARLVDTGVYDWIFDGEADYAFPLALERHFRGNGQLDDIVGLTWRDADGYRTNGCSAGPGGKPLVGAVENLDDIPFPAWDLVDFDAYAERPNMAAMLRGKRYAPIFTSRGCPFLCTYCHDIFGKKFRWRSPENVLAEVRLLREKYGVDELQIVDDIFNMNSGRMKEICRGLAPFHFKITFPNGLRADILDEDDVEALTSAGMYFTAVAIETVTPRLQDLIKKRLRLDALKRSVAWMAQRGVVVKGFFMIGFPTETVDEIKATINWAIDSQLTHAGFFQVVPQPGTPLYEQAKRENETALEKMILLDQYSPTCWYQEAYKIDLMKMRRNAIRTFYLTSPRRMWRIWKNTSWTSLVQGLKLFLNISGIAPRQDRAEEPLPEALQSLTRLYSTEEQGEPQAARQPATMPVVELAPTAAPVG